MEEDKKLKIFLVLQSFCPLFILIFIRHVGNIDLVVRFFKELFCCDWSVFGKAIHNTALGDVAVSIFCIIWFAVTIIVSIGFNYLQIANWDSKGKTIMIVSEKKDSGVTFLITFVLPLLDNDVTTLRGFVFFVVLLFMVIFLLVRSDLFYQNPVLVALRYKTYEFNFTDAEDNKIYIGITKGKVPYNGVAVKYKCIADDVLLVCEENR